MAYTQTDAVKVLNNEKRRKILRAIVLNPEISPSDVTVLIEEELGNVAYHVRVAAWSARDD